MVNESLCMYAVFLKHFSKRLFNTRTHDLQLKKNQPYHSKVKMAKQLQESGKTCILKKRLFPLSITHSQTSDLSYSSTDDKMVSLGELGND